MSYPLMVFTAVLNQVYLLLEFKRQNCVYSSSRLISISAVAACYGFSSSLAAPMHASSYICSTCPADLCTPLQATLTYDLSLIGPPPVAEHCMCHLGSTTQRRGTNEFFMPLPSTTQILRSIFKNKFYSCSKEEQEVQRVASVHYHLGINSK